MNKQTVNTSNEHGPLPHLEQWRRQIDHLDAQLLHLLAQRRQVVEKIGQIKRERGLHPLDEQRWQEVLHSKLTMARDLELSPDFIRDLYELIHAYSLTLESKESES